MTIRQFNYPTTMLYGPGALGELGKRLADTHPGAAMLLVTDPGLVNAGVARAVTDHLQTWGLSITVHSDVHGNPVEADILTGVDAYRSSGASAIIALGGGSPMDAAKAVAVLAREFGVPCQVSLEEFMACAVGGCAGCAVLVRTDDGPAMQKVCVDGPVFEADAHLDATPRSGRTLREGAVHRVSDAARKGGH